MIPQRISQHISQRISHRSLPLLSVLAGAAGMLILACAVDAPLGVDPVTDPRPDGGPNLPPSTQSDGGGEDPDPDAIDGGCGADGGGECTPGETRTGACGRCGTRPETCSAACVWVGGACTGEKVCNPDDYEVQSGNIGCSLARQVRTRTCSSACDWGEWSECLSSGWSKTPSIAPDAVQLTNGTMWTGQELILQGDSCMGGSVHAYDPSTDALRPVVDPLPTTEGSLWTWTGTHAFVFGGSRCEGLGVEQDGALLDITTGAIVHVTGPGGFVTPPALSAWVPSTGDVLVLSAPHWDGTLTPPYAFRPATGAWRALPAGAVREPKHALWTGTRLLVTGTCGDLTRSQCVDAWDPTTETWSPLVLPAKLQGAREYGDQGMTPFSTSLGLVLWGAWDKAMSANVGGILNETTGTWTLITAPAPAVLESGNSQSVFWAKDQLWVWTGGTLGPGAKWDPVTKTWTPMPLGGPTEAPMPARSTGTEVIFWGGYSAGSRGWVFHP